MRVHLIKQAKVIIFKNIQIYLFITVIFLSSCVDEDTYSTPCKGKFGSQKVIDSIIGTFGLKSAIVEFEESYKNGIGAPSNCDTITLVIKGDNIPVINTDTFVKSVSSFFFNDTANADVKYLKLKTTHLFPAIGRLEAGYLVDRNLFNNYLASSQIHDINYSTEYKIVNETPYKTYAGNDNKLSIGIRVDVFLPAESQNFKDLADEIKQKYKRVITEKSLDEFEVNITIGKPDNKFCTSKVYYIFYESE